MRIDTGIIIERREGVYEPAEDTHLIIESLEVHRGDKVVEIGSGTGIISLHCAKAGAEVMAVDISEDAVDCTRLNSARNSLNLKVSKSNLFENVNGKFDLIIFNPPYLPDAETRDIRWSGGPTGLDVIRRFLGSAGEHLEEDGRIVLVISSLAGYPKFEEFFSEFGFEASILRKKRLFFETIYTVELRAKSAKPIRQKTAAP